MAADRTPSPPLGITPEEKEVEDRAALERATAILARTIALPEEVAAENAQLRSSIKGAYALLHVLVRREMEHTGEGDVFVPFADHSNIPATDGDLQVYRDPKNGDITLRLHKANRAERRNRRA